MTEISPVHPDLLADHVASLRRLAHSLVRCPAEAEDALQETWLRALQAPRVASERIRGWLATVLRNVIASQHRTTVRRERRETAVTGSSLESSTLDLLERRETLRTIMDAVLELDDDLQAVVFLRHFDGLAPRDVAMRLELPIQVVYRRLKTAHEKLRTSLAERFGQRDRKWRGALAGLFGLPAPKLSSALSGSALLKGAAVLTLNAKLAVSTAALALLALPMFFLDDGDQPVGPMVAAESAENTPDGEAAELEGDIERTDIEEAAPAAGMAALQAREPHEFSLQVRAFDQFDMPAPNVGVVLGPERHALNRAGSTGDDGVLEVKWRGRTDTMRVAIGSSKNPASLRLVELRAGHTAQISMRTHRVFVEHGSIVWSSRLHAYGGGGAANLPDMEFDGEYGRFVTPTPDSADAVPTVGGFELSTTRAGTFVSLAINESRNAPEQGFGKIAGMILDAVGGPASKAHIVASAPGRPDVFATADEDGKYELPKVQPGSYTVRAGGGDLGVALGEVVCDEGETTRFDARLDRGLELQGRLVDDAGRPLVGWRVEASSSDGTGEWIDVAKTDGQGVFRIPNVPDRAHELAFYRKLDKRVPGRIPDWQRQLWPSVAPIDITVPRDQQPFGKLAATLSVDPAQLSGIEARVWHTASSRGITLHPNGEGELPLEQLPFGDYRLVIGGERASWTQVANFRVAPAQEIDLGVVAIDPTGTIVIPEGSDIALVRIDPSVFSKLVTKGGAAFTIDGMGNIPTVTRLRSTLGNADGTPVDFEIAPVKVESEATPRLLLALGEPNQNNAFIEAAVPEADVESAKPKTQPQNAVPAGRYLAIPLEGEPIEIEVAAGHEVRVELPAK